MGRDCRDGCRDDRSGGTGEQAEGRLPDGLPVVFGENTEGRPGDYPGASPRHSCGKAGGMCVRRELAGRCVNKTPAQPHRCGADLGRTCVFRFP